MIRIGFVGVPGAGKTTTARALAGQIRFHTDVKTVELVAEYARVYIHKYGIDSIYDQVRIMNKQIEEEDRYPASTDVLITDSPVFLGFGYALDMRKCYPDPEAKKNTMLINDIFKDMNKLNEQTRYDIIFHLPPTLKPVDDGIRAAYQFEDEWRTEADIRLKALFSIFKPKLLVTLKSDNVQDRVAESIKIFKEFQSGNTHQQP